MPSYFVHTYIYAVFQLIIRAEQTLPLICCFLWVFRLISKIHIKPGTNNLHTATLSFVTGNELFFHITVTVFVVNSPYFQLAIYVPESRSFLICIVCSSVGNMSTLPVATDVVSAAGQEAIDSVVATSGPTATGGVPTEPSRRRTNIEV